MSRNSTGPQLRVFTHNSSDEKNTPRRIRMLINTGGGDPATGTPEGIHWRMNISNEITYVAADEKRQIIPYIHVKDLQGRVTEYFAKDSTLTKDQVASASRHRMDCVDCHNRPHAHLRAAGFVGRQFLADPPARRVAALSQTAGGRRPHGKLRHHRRRHAGDRQVGRQLLRDQVSGLGQEQAVRHPKRDRRTSANLSQHDLPRNEAELANAPQQTSAISISAVAFAATTANT